MPMQGIDPTKLDDERLIRELQSLYDTRMETLRHGSDDALDHSTRRLRELEHEYVRRRPEREVDPERLRDGARERTAPDRP
jgi:hypothetical protein